MHFIRSKEPVGVGRFGVVYKASNINIKISKSKGDNFNHEHTCEILSHFPINIMAVKIIRNKKVWCPGGTPPAAQANFVGSFACDAHRVF